MNPKRTQVSSETSLWYGLTGFPAWPAVSVVMLSGVSETPGGFFSHAGRMRLPVLLSGRMLKRSDAAFDKRINQAISPIADHLKTRPTAIQLNPRSVHPDNAGGHPKGQSVGTDWSVVQPSENSAFIAMNELSHCSHRLSCR